MLEGDRNGEESDWCWKVVLLSWSRDGVYHRGEVRGDVRAKSRCEHVSGNSTIWKLGKINLVLNLGKCCPTSLRLVFVLPLFSDFHPTFRFISSSDSSVTTEALAVPCTPYQPQQSGSIMSQFLATNTPPCCLSFWGYVMPVCWMTFSIYSRRQLVLMATTWQIHRALLSGLPTL